MSEIQEDNIEDVSDIENNIDNIEDDVSNEDVEDIEEGDSNTEDISNVEDISSKFTSFCSGKDKDKNEKKSHMKLVLDLDSTLIYSEPSENINRRDIEKMSKFKFYDMDGYYTVFERPHLQKFLAYAFKNFDVSVWTAASLDYAVFIIENILLRKNRHLDCFFHSYHCDISEKYKKGHKGLSLLWEHIPGFAEGNTLIIDDLPDVCENQEANCINIKPFVYSDENSENDKELLDMIKVLKQKKKEYKKK